MPERDSVGAMICSGKPAAGASRSSGCPDVGLPRPAFALSRFGASAIAPYYDKKKPRRSQRDLLEKYFAVFAVSAVPSGPWIASEAVAETGSDLNLDHRAADHLVVAFEVKHHTVDAHTEDVFDGEATLDLGLARFVRGAVGRRL